MKKFLCALAIVLAPLTALAAPTIYDVDTIATGVDSAGSTAGLADASDLPSLVGRGIGVLLGLLGILFVVLVVYAGFLYLTAQGEDTNVKKAKKLLSQAVIGLILIVSAYAISNVVIDSLTTISGT